MTITVFLVQMIYVGVGKISVSVVTTTGSDDTMATGTHGCNEMLHNTLWNVLPLMLQCHKKLVVEVSQVVDSSGKHPDPEHPRDVLLA